MFGINKSNVVVSKNVPNGVFNARKELIAKINFKMNNEIAYLTPLEVMDLSLAVDCAERAMSIDSLKSIAAGVGVDFGVQSETINRLSRC